MELSDKTIKYLMKDLEKQKDEFNEHPVPKCVFMFYIWLPYFVSRDENEQTIGYNEYEAKLFIRKKL